MKLKKESILLQVSQFNMDVIKALAGPIVMAQVKCGAGQTKNHQTAKSHVAVIQTVMAIFTNVYQHVAYDLE